MKSITGTGTPCRGRPSDMTSSWRIHFEILALTAAARSALWEAVADLEGWNGSVRLPADSVVLGLVVGEMEPRSIRRAVVAATELVNGQDEEPWGLVGDEDALRAATGLLDLLGSALKRHREHPAVT